VAADAARRELSGSSGVSLINKVLQDLDRRNAASPTGATSAQHVHAVRGHSKGHEWFWRVLALLVLLSVGWVGWVAYQIQPQPIATELALRAGEDAARKKTVKPAPAVAIPAQAAAEKPASAEQAATTPAKQAATPAPPELFKLALSIESPITQRRPKPAAKTPSPQASLPVSSVSKRDRTLSSADEAETLFRQGVALLNQARISEAQSEFMAALFRSPQHEAARQALIATRIERRQIDEARRLLEEGLVLNPAHTQFASVLARIHVVRGDYRAAAGVLNIPGEAARNDGDYQTVLGAVMQRLGRHAEAAEAFQNATRVDGTPGATWVALGISLEAIGRKADAAQAYRRSLGLAMAPEARSYAESRVRLLD